MTKQEILEKRRLIFGNQHMKLFSDTIYNMMDEYAKQQAIAFVKWAIDSGKIIGDNYGEAYIPLEEDDIYNQFMAKEIETNK
jgi:hypothetical protein